MTLLNVLWNWLLRFCLESEQTWAEESITKTNMAEEAGEAEEVKDQTTVILSPTSGYSHYVYHLLFTFVQI